MLKSVKMSIALSTVWDAAALQLLPWRPQDLEILQHWLGVHSTGQQPVERRSICSDPYQYEFDGMSCNGNIWRSYVWAVCSKEGAQPRGRLQFCRRDRDGPQIVSLQGSASSTETTMQ